MSSQQFSAAQREAIWLAHECKCAYTRELIDVSDFHIDHILPESLAGDSSRFESIKVTLDLPVNFDLFGYDNLLPCKARANLQKGPLILDNPRLQFFLWIASSKKDEVEANLARIEKRKNRGKAVILLQQCLERGELTPDEVSSILLKHSDSPEAIFSLIEGMRFADTDIVKFITKSDLDTLSRSPIHLGHISGELDCVTLTNEFQDTRHVRTCYEFDESIKQGFFVQGGHFHVSAATPFIHLCGLISALQNARTPLISHIAVPRVSILDLDRLPFLLFPCFEKPSERIDTRTTYQDKVTDGTLIIRRLRQNLLQIEEPEGMGQQLIEVVRADFNGDGFEDMLLFEYCYATHGTFCFSGIRILTRTSPEGMFEELVTGKV